MVKIDKKEIGVEGASLIGASVPFGSKKQIEPNRFAIVIDDQLFPQLAFSETLRILAKNGVGREKIIGIDFRGSVKGPHLKKYVRNSAGIVLGKAVKVRFDVPEQETNRLLRKDITKV